MSLHNIFTRLEASIKIKEGSRTNNHIQQSPITLPFPEAVEGVTGSHTVAQAGWEYTM